MIKALFNKGNNASQYYNSAKVISIKPYKYLADNGIGYQYQPIIAGKSP